MQIGWRRHKVLPLVKWSWGKFILIREVAALLLEQLTRMTSVLMLRDQAGTFLELHVVGTCFTGYPKAPLWPVVH